MSLPINIKDLLHGKPVEIRLERHEMMIISYPGPDRSVRLKQLQAGHAQSRRYRNRRALLATLPGSQP